MSAQWRLERANMGTYSMLARASGITTFDGMKALLERYFPREPADARRLAIIGQFAETLNARPSEDIG